MRDRKHLVFEALVKNIRNIYDIEQNLADQDPYKKTKLLKKWQSVECDLIQGVFYLSILLHCNRRWVMGGLI